jgi:hypothetical protein
MVLVVVGCSNEAPSTPTTFPVTAAVPVTAFPMTAAATTAAPATAAGAGDTEPCHVYARRCDPGCRTAFFAAIPRFQIQPDDLLAPQIAALTPCLVRCNQSHGAGEGCVGASSVEQCNCQLDCYRAANLAPEQAARFRQIAHGLHEAIAPACE